MFLFAREQARTSFSGRRAVEPEVAGFVDDAHAAATEFAADLVLAERAARSGAACHGPTQMWSNRRHLGRNLGAGDAGFQLGSGGIEG